VPNSAPTPPPSDSNDDFALWELATAKFEVASFVRLHGRFRRHDTDDLVQECLTHWWQQRDRYDERRGANRKTFLKRVVRNRLKDLKREERAEKRGAGKPDRSLDEALPSDDGEGSTLADFLRDQSPDIDPEARALQSELRTGIHRATPQLTPQQQALVDGLSSGQTISELARSMDIRRSTLYDELKRIKAAFESAGLREFLN